MITWMKPGLGCVKLNTDGSCVDNPDLSGDGGLLRDHMGYFLYSFTRYYDVGTNNEAKLQAILDGLRIC